MSNATPAAARAAALDERHGLPGVLRFCEGPGGLLLAEVSNAQARATICLQGAPLTHWQPRGQAEPVLWLSDAARYLEGKSVRGGIPVCWPWFGTPADRPQGPAHGFARNHPWEVVATGARPDGSTGLRLQLDDNPATRALWPGAFALSLDIVVGATLDLELCTRNTGSVELHVTEALHTYFRIGDIAAVAVRGLEGVDYFDAAAHAAGAAPVDCRQQGPVRFDGEVDRVYASGGPCWIDDPLLLRRLHVSATGSASTVVWNPSAAKAHRLGDMGDDGWRRMLCVESGNARDSGVSVAPGGTHRLAVRYRVAPWSDADASAAT